MYMYVYVLKQATLLTSFWGNIYFFERANFRNLCDAIVSIECVCTAGERAEPRAKGSTAKDVLYCQGDPHNRENVRSL